MVYGSYKKARNASWQVLIDHRVGSLPVGVIDIALASGIKVIKNSDVGILTGCESGSCIYDGKDWFLIYDDECNLGRCRFTIAHELGHIFLGHELIDGHHGRTFNILKPPVESEADIFASRLLAPACVLWALNIHGANDIADLCNISMAAAKIRAERMEQLYERNKFLTSPLERMVFEQFSEFIESKKEK